MNKEGATLGIIVGLTLVLAMILMMRSVQIFGTETQIIDDLFGINAQGVGVVGMILNIVIALVVSRLTAPPPEEIQQMLEDIRVPA
jgi:cation/acetate symporter